MGGSDIKNEITSFHIIRRGKLVTNLESWTYDYTFIHRDTPSLSCGMLYWMMVLTIAIFITW